MKIGNGSRRREGKNKDPCEILSLQNHPQEHQGPALFVKQANFGGLPVQIKSENEGVLSTPHEDVGTAIPSLDLEILGSSGMSLSLTTSSILTQ